MALATFFLLLAILAAELVLWGLREAVWAAVVLHGLTVISLVRWHQRHPADDGPSS